MHVRTGPSLADAIANVLHQGTSTTATGVTSGPWTQVDYAGQTRWIYSSYLTTNSPDAPSSTSTASAPVPTTRLTPVWASADVHVRTGPSLSDAIVDVLPQNASTTATGITSGPWTQVDYNGQTRWIYSSYLTHSAPGTATSARVVGFAVTTTALMIRTTSGSDFVYLGDIPTGTIVALTGVKTPGVAQIVYHGALRWVNGRYLVRWAQPTPRPGRRRTRPRRPSRSRWRRWGRSTSGVAPDPTPMTAAGWSCEPGGMRA